MVGLVVETPLTEGDGRAGVLHLLHHVHEVLLLLVVELLEVLGAGDVDVVLGLGLRRLEGAGQNADLRVLYHLRHLRVTDVLVDDDTVHQGRVLQAASGLAIDLFERKS